MKNKKLNKLNKSNKKTRIFGIRKDKLRKLMIQNFLMMPKNKDQIMRRIKVMKL